MSNDDLRPADLAIVGMAALFPGAPDLASFWHNISTGADAITGVPATRWDPAYFDADAWAHPTSDKFYCRRGGFIDDIATFEPAKFGVMPVAVDSTDPDQLLALRMATDAIADAGGQDCLGDRSRVGVILGRGGYLSPAGARLEQRVRVSRQLVATLIDVVPSLTASQVEEVRLDFLAQLGPEHPDASIGLVPNLAASRIANRLDLQGPAYTVDAACASSLLAVDHAGDELARGRCDVVIAGGVHVCDDLGLWSVFSQLRALSPTEHIRPFDRRADGLLIGEGIGMVVLRRLADAQQRGDRVYAVIRGTGVASDGRGSSLMRPRVEGQVLALQRAWAAAGVDPEAPGAVGMVEAHGTATPVGDEAELTTLRTVFGDDGPPIGLGSVKSMIGHAMPAAGMAALIKSALALHHRVLPPTLHCEEPHPALADSRLTMLTAARSWDVPEGGGARRAAVNAFGFGGINAHLVVEETPDAPVGARVMPRLRPAPRRVTGVSQRVLLLAGSSVDDLARQLALPDAELLGRDDIHAVPTAGPWRLAIVDANPTRLELARKVVTRARPWRGRNDVWFTSAPLLAEADAKLAFLFPGVEQTFNPQVEGVAAQFGLPEPLLEGTDTLGRHGAATIGVGRLLDGALRRLGISPDLVAGHSIGEWNAMIAAGMHDGAEIEAVIASFSQGTLEVPGLAFAALGCGADVAEAAIVGLDRIVVSHDNCPHQSVICGDEARVVATLDRLRAEGVMGQILTFRSGFHSPMVEPYLGRVGHLLKGLPLHPARIPVWSATTAAPYPTEAAAVQELSIRHLLEPVRFGPMVRHLHDAGVRVFVQVGSGSLTAFVDDTLRGRDQLTISATTAANSGLDQLLRVAAALWAEGCSPNFAPLAPETTMSTGSVHLRLGAPTIHVKAAFPGVSGPVRSVPTLPTLPTSPLQAEFEALLAETAAAAASVIESWNSPAPAPVAPAPAAARKATSTRLVSLETMPYLLDHCFYQQAAGWPEVSDGFPVVPMTTMLEMLLEGAQPLAGGRTLIGLTKVRALRWLAATEPVTVTVTASVDGDGNIDVALEGYAHAKVMVEGCYPPAPPARHEPLQGEQPSPVSAADLYRERWLFHGPAFQGVSEVEAIGDDGIRGQLVSLAAPGGLLDNAGQLMGFWIETTVPVDKLPFPAAIERLEFFSPHPAPGTAVGCTVWIRSMKGNLVTSDMEVRHPDGTVFARITGWTDRRFRTDPEYDGMLRAPQCNRIAEVEPGGWFLLRDRWPDPANRELIMRRYLGAAEQRHYTQQNPQGRHRWLLGRIAAKDATRQWLWDQGAGPLFPAEAVIENEATGRPRVRQLPPEFAISIAHAGDFAVAMVGPAGRVGIDIEAVEERTPQFEAVAFTDGERALLARLASGGSRRLEHQARFWVAKESVAKAFGTGLQGRPHRFEVSAVTGSRLLVSDLDQGSEWSVDTASLLQPDGAVGHIVGWTTTDSFSPASTFLDERISHGR